MYAASAPSLFSQSLTLATVMHVHLFFNSHARTHAHTIIAHAFITCKTE